MPHDGSDIYIEDKEMTSMSPNCSTDVPNNNYHHQELEKDVNNYTKSTDGGNRPNNQCNNHNTMSTSPTSYNNQKPYIPGTYLLLTKVRKNKCETNIKTHRLHFSYRISIFVRSLN